MIALIDYGAGNVASVSNALKSLGQDYKVTNNETEICNANKVIFPGVGEASFAIKQLHKLNLYSLLRIIKRPILGVCLGLQLMAEFSTEGDIQCLGIFPEDVLKFDPQKVKVPHMGWNDIHFKKESKLFSGIKEGERFYFANSYYLPVNEHTTAYCNNSVDFSASMEKENYYGVQFHPEKSSDVGLKVLKNFIELC